MCFRQNSYHFIINNYNQLFIFRIWFSLFLNKHWHIARLPLQYILHLSILCSTAQKISFPLHFFRLRQKLQQYTVKEMKEKVLWHFITFIFLFNVQRRNWTIWKRGNYFLCVRSVPKMCFQLWFSPCRCWTKEEKKPWQNISRSSKSTEFSFFKK